jgi:hypothetical protein
MDFDAEKIVVRQRLRDLGRRLAHPETDLEDRRRAATEEALEIERRRRKGNAKARQELVERALLRR